MQGDEGMVHQALEEFVHQFRIQGAEHGPLEVHMELQAGAAGKVHHDAGQGFVQGHIGVAVAGQALLVAQGLGEGLADGDADVFHRVVTVDVQVALGLHLQIDQAVAGDLVQHVVEEGNAGIELGTAGAVQIETDRDLGFEGISGNFGLPHGSTVEWVSRKQRP